MPAASEQPADVPLSEPICVQTTPIPRTLRRFNQSMCSRSSLGRGLNLLRGRPRSTVLSRSRSYQRPPDIATSASDSDHHPAAISMGGTSLPSNSLRSPNGESSWTVRANSGFPGQVASPDTGSTNTTMSPIRRTATTRQKQRSRQQSRASWNSATSTWTERTYASKRQRNQVAAMLVHAIVGTLAPCDPFGIPSTSHWTGAAIIVKCWRTKTCIVTRSRTSRRPMPSSLAG